MGRSIMRAVRIARSVGRPSRLKKPPGIFPAAYMRSSTSTVSGKKSAPSRGSIRPCAVANTIVSPERTTTEPSACFASLPVSNVISRPPIVTLTSARRSVAIAICLFLHSREWGFESTSPADRFGGSLKSPLSLIDPVPGFSLAWAYRSALPAQPQFFDQCPVSLQVVFLEIGQEPTTTPDELQQPAARVVVLRMRAQMLREVVDALRQQRNLHLGRARVVLARPMLAHDLQLGFLRQGPLSRQSQQSAGSRRKAAAASRNRVATIYLSRSFPTRRCAM